MPFNHEQLNVYSRTLSFNAKVAAWTGQWDATHAVSDQLSRAAESILENIAMASAAYSSAKKRRMDYAIGSALECAACLDLVLVKGLLKPPLVSNSKSELSQILRMLIGLRKSWSSSPPAMREPQPEYHTEPRDETNSAQLFFHHEALDVYRVSLEVAEAFYAANAVTSLSKKRLRRLDELLTSMVLNIAEGNGRFSSADQARFLGTSHESAIKLAANLDLCVVNGQLPAEVVANWKVLFSRIASMTSALIAVKRDDIYRQSSRQGSRQR